MQIYLFTLSLCLLVVIIQAPEPEYPILDTCDFDLIDPYSEFRYAHYYYVGVCADVLNNPSKRALRELMDREVHYFKIFQRELQNYEVRRSGKSLCQDGQYWADSGLRNAIYAKSKLHQCYEANELTRFLNCSINKRIDMINMIPGATFD